MDKLPKINRDSSYKRRGGTAQWILLSCGVCKENLALYQKDGPGKLFRLYLDRLTSTSGERPFSNLGKTAINALTCNGCQETIGIPMTYEKDDFPRTALRLTGAGINKTILSPRNLPNVPDIDITQTMRSIIKSPDNTPE